MECGWEEGAAVEGGWEEGAAVEGGWEEAQRLGVAGEASHADAILPTKSVAQHKNQPFLFPAPPPPSTLPSPTHPTHTFAK